MADATDLSGETVTITGPWTGNEAEKVNAVFDYFEQATGATVNYSGSDSFEQDIVIATQAGSAPEPGRVPAARPCRRHGGAGILTPLPEGTGDSWPRTTPPGKAGSIWAPTPMPMATISFTACSTAST